MNHAFKHSAIDSLNCSIGKRMNEIFWECYIQVSIDIPRALIKVLFFEFYQQNQQFNNLPFHFLETFMSIHKISISVRVHNEQRSETKPFTNELNSFSCPNQLTKVSTLRCRTVNRNMKFDCDKSSQLFQSDLVKL